MPEPFRFPPNENIPRYLFTITYRDSDGHVIRESKLGTENKPKTYGDARDIIIFVLQSTLDDEKHEGAHAAVIRDHCGGYEEWALKFDHGQPRWTCINSGTE